METVQNNLTRSLLAMENSDLETGLLAWEKENPLVRNVFIFNLESDLEYPGKALAATGEEREFKNRFAPLLSGRLSFDFNRLSEEDKKSGPTDSSSSRQRLYALSREKVKPPAESGSAPKGSSWDSRSGWIPWFSENRLYLLGWAQKDKTGPIYGIELELMTFLSRLVTDFPENRQPGTALVLMDGNSAHIHHSGPGQADHPPVARVMISPRLPHWAIGVFTDKKVLGTGQSFLILSLILVGILVLAIVFGGILITRLTLEKIKDARQKTSFVASVSHELKTPLTSIRMYGELLLSKRIIDPDKQNRYLEVIVGESGRLTRLINNVLDFGKLEQGQKKYQTCEFDMAVFLEELLQTHSLRIQTTGLALVREFVPGECRVNTDRDAMEQVVLNLLDNALKYGGDGQFIKVILARENQDILVKIQDDGPGIQPGFQDQIFEKFFRIDNSLTASHPGSGLGLSIARQMVYDLGGDLFLDPGTRQGSCFTLRMPLHETD
ncbi:MAG: HAMP domain-containing histidine kinase [Desulfobacter sp.]|nr:HAMP domain-containing histidine kinase [Desulfobacter sp.]